MPPWSAALSGPVMVALAVSALGAFVYWTAFRRAAAEFRVMQPPAPLADRPPVLVIVPARNELGIADTLATLLDGHWPALRVCVYDDRSTDDTAARVARLEDTRVHLTRGTAEPPAGVFGKPHALVHATAAARAAWPAHAAASHVFLDADVHLTPDALARVLAALEHADVVSAAPTLELRSVVEAVFVPAFATVAGMRHPPAEVHDAASPTAFLNGQLIALRPDVLDAVGGFGAVTDTVLEDVALAARLKAAGHRLRLLTLGEGMRTRMYSSWPEIREGFGKNAVPLLGGAAPARAVSLLGLGLTALLYGPALGLLALRAPGTAWLGWAAAFIVAFIAQARIRRLFGAPAWSALFAPLAALGVTLVFWQAARAATSGGTITWKGRTYNARG